MRWALVKQDNTVANVIIWDGQAPLNSVNDFRLIQIIGDESCGINYTFDENENPRFSPPPYVRSTITFTSYQFLTRFTSEERTSIRSMAQVDNMIADFLMLATSAQEIINTDPVTLAGMDYIVSVGIITEQRKNEILNFLY
jgi:hypothetical protein